MNNILTKHPVDVRNYIQNHYKPYDGDESFLAPTSERTKKLWSMTEKLLQEELKEGVLDIDTSAFAGISNFKPGYMDKELEVIVGLQSDQPLKRVINPFGGFRMVEQSLAAYDYSISEEMKDYFTKYRKTHNDGVFDAYTDEMRSARSAGLLTGLPDAYGRGRIIGDYRRLPLYGLDYLLANKAEEITNLSAAPATEEVIQLREELSEQVRALKEMKVLGQTYGVDLSKPANTAQEAVQYFYFAYLAAVKENNGAAMSLGRNTAFLDIFIERDLEKGLLTEESAQELIDQLVIKLRLVRHLRTPEYDTLFAGDPTWVTESIGGLGLDGRHMVTKTAYRFLHTLTNLGPAPEPNMTVLWSPKLPKAFKAYCSRMSIQTGAIQYENDDLMRPIYGDDYAIACCVSPMAIGKQMQFFGARANLAKALLYSLNEGKDEMKRTRDGEPIKVLDEISPLSHPLHLDYDEVWSSYQKVLSSLAKLYVNTMNTIHYMHDKYAYEAGQLALHDAAVDRIMAFGVAGLSIVADSLSAIKYAQVTARRNAAGLTEDFTITGDYPAFGNDDARVDELANQVVTFFMEELRKHQTYRKASHSLSLLTITSNVVYGKKTGATPDGRQAGAPFAPGANPMHGRDENGVLASLNSVAKLPFEGVCEDGISNTMSLVPKVLGKELDEQISSLTHILDGYMLKGGFHLNVNVLSRALLREAMETPSKYPLLTIRVSGYAVHFNRLTKEQQYEVLSRTFHER